MFIRLFEILKTILEHSIFKFLYPKCKALRLVGTGPFVEAIYSRFTNENLRHFNEYLENQIALASILFCFAGDCFLD